MSDLDDDLDDDCLDGEDESDEIDARLAELRADRKTMRWVRRFLECAKAMPDTVMVFVAAGTPCVLALKSDGDSFDKARGYDQRAVIADSQNGKWDGGDWP